MINITGTAESETIADLIAIIRDMANGIEESCKNSINYHETELANGV